MTEAFSRDASSRPRFFGQIKFTPAEELDSRIRDFYRPEVRERMAKSAMFLYSNNYIEYASLSGSEGSAERVALASLERILQPRMNDQRSLAEGLMVRRHRQGPNSPVYAVSLNMGVILDMLSARAVAPVFGIRNYNTVEAHHLIPAESLIDDDDRFKQACRALADATRSQSRLTKIEKVEVAINHRKH